MKLLRDNYVDDLPIPLSEFERAQVFRRVEAELERRPRRRTLPRLLGALGVVAVVGGSAAGVWARVSPGAAGVQRDAHEKIELPGGARALIAPLARLRVDLAEPQRVHLTLFEGAASFEVPEVAGRSFVVGAGSVEIEILGGHADIDVMPSAANQDGATDVTAREGRVEIRRRSGGPPLALGGGERWSNAAPARAAVSAAE